MAFTSSLARYVMSAQKTPQRARYVVIDYLKHCFLMGVPFASSWGAVRCFKFFSLIQQIRWRIVKSLHLKLNKLEFFSGILFEVTTVIALA